MFLMTENLPSPHKSLGIVNATSHLMLPSEAIDEFEAFDQLFPAVEEKLKHKASAKGADGIVGVRFTTNVANVQVAPKFLVLTGYGTMVQLLSQKS